MTCDDRQTWLAHKHEALALKAQLGALGHSVEFVNLPWRDQVTRLKKLLAKATPEVMTGAEAYAKEAEQRTKASNPKDALGSTRAPLHLLPLPALVAWSLAHLEGGLKYGFWNWTIVGVRASIYVAATARHLFKWFFGQDKDPTTGVHHLGYVMACCAILIDAEHRKKLTDDRPPALPDLDGLFAHAEASVKRLIELYGGCNPRHYTIADSERETPEK